MPRTRMSEEDVIRLVERCDLVRVAFHDGISGYLIPLGCVWCDGAFYGVGEPGRKTTIAADHPEVAFQTDTARETGLFEWESVTGNGEFAIVDDPDEARAALARLLATVAGAPEWWRAEQGPKLAEGRIVVWRVRPNRMDGVRYLPPG